MLTMGITIPYEVGIWPDIDLNCQLLSKKLKRKLYNHLKTVQSPRDYDEISAKLEDFLINISQESNTISFRDRTCLYRAYWRIMQLLNNRSWINLVKTNDTLIHIAKIAINSKLTQKEQWKKIEPIIEMFDYESDPESHRVEIALITLRLNYLVNAGRADELPALITRAREIYKKNSSDLLYLWNFFFTLVVYEWILWGQRKIDEAWDIIEEMERLAQKVKSPSMMSPLANARGAYYSHLSQVDKAVQEFDLMYTITQETGNLNTQVTIMTNKADAIIKVGKFEEVITLLKQALSLFDELSAKRPRNPFNRIIILNNLGEAYAYIEDYENAIKYAKEAFDSIDPTLSLSYVKNEVNKTYMNALLGNGNVEEVNRILNEIGKILEKHPMDPFYLTYYYFQGKRKILLKKLDEAKNAFLKALEYANKTRNFTYQLQIQLNLVEIFLQKYIKTQNEDLLAIVGNFLETIIIFAKEQAFNYFLAQAYIMRANLEYVQKNYRKARSTLELAQKIDHTSVKLGEFIQKRIQDITDLDRRATFLSATEILQDSFSQLTRSFIISKNQPTKAIQYHIYALIVLDKSGIPVYTHYVDHDLSTKEVFISGLLSAVNVFSTQLLNSSETGALKSIRHENMEILLEQVHNNLVALITDKDNFDLRNKMLELCTNIATIKTPDQIYNLQAKKTELDGIFSEIFG